MGSTKRTTTRRGGYTLVEMLVAIALVLLIMLLLASVFEMASATMTKQRGTAENDQQARTIATVLKGDLRARSFRAPYPFEPGKGTLAISDWDARRGYFSISENDPNNDTDDVLSFTVDYSGATYLTTSLISDNTAVYGQSALLWAAPAPASPTQTQQNTYLQQNRNQPEFDDGYPVVNHLGISHAAEVVYFLRGGNLYRRTLLIREIQDDGGDTSPTVQPPQITGPYPAQPGGYVVNGNGIGWTFWRDFDYSAVFDPGATRPYFLNFRSPSGGGGPALNNQPPAPKLDSLYPISLGVPRMRYGHWIGDAMGRPVEYLRCATANGGNGVPGNVGDDNANGIPEDLGELGFYGDIDVNGNGSIDSIDIDFNSDGSVAPRSDDVFIGRFNAQETAHSAFGYPGQIAAGNPYLLANLTLNPYTRVVNQYGNQIYRRGEDVLMTNVISFDVKVWDGMLKKYVDLGHNTRTAAGAPIGHYHILNALNRNRSYGNRYDTWHPEMINTGVSPPVAALSPYRPRSLGPDLAPGVAGVDDDNDNLVDDPDELGWPGSDDEVPLQSIQITVRFLDPAKHLVRQVTIDESLTD